MRILLAEDNLKLGKLIQNILSSEGYRVDWVTDGEEAYDSALYEKYDLLILDWMLPKMTGVEVCRKVRKEDYTQGILMLTAKGMIEDRVEGLDAGADDYLVKPFEIQELLARIRALSRRSNQKINEEIIRVGEFLLNRTEKILLRDEAMLQLSPREFQILDLLIQNQGKVVPREILMDRIWGWESEISSNILDSYIKILRKKLHLPTKFVVIDTVRGIGYRLEVKDV